MLQREFMKKKDNEEAKQTTVEIEDKEIEYMCKVNYQSKTELQQGVNVRGKTCRILTMKYSDAQNKASTKYKRRALLGTLKSDCLRQVVVL